MMEARKTPGANVNAIPDGFRLTIPAGDNRQYRVAQLDDYAKLSRGHFPAHPPWTLSLLARASASSLPGTWGFGLWNDPFGLSLGFGGNPWRLPALPNAAWFFHASQENYLSLQSCHSPLGKPHNSDKANPKGSAIAANEQGIASDIQRPRNDMPANGFMAQAFRSPAIPSTLLALAGIPALPLLATRKSRGVLRKLAGRAVREDGVRLGVDATQWRGYRLEWSPMRCAFWVDDALVLESPVSPRPPLGLVIWIDNQYAAFTPEGKIGFGVLANTEPAWLEVKNVDVK